MKWLIAQAENVDAAPAALSYFVDYSILEGIMNACWTSGEVADVADIAKS